MHLYPINGAAHKPKKDDTPWSYRDATWSEVIVASTRIRPIPITLRVGQKLLGGAASIRSGSAYVNFMMDGEGDDRIRATYRDNFDRLARTKAKYDPTTFSA